MCGIVGILGREDVAPLLVDALKRLEYRGYDSAGVATLEDGRIDRRRAEGKLRNLDARLKDRPLPGHVGIGHTRWATHGVPNETNAHPHSTERVAVVHNGIIENFAELRRELEEEGVTFDTQTDTETIVHLLDRELKAGKEPVAAAEAVIPRLKGAFATGFLFAGEDNLLIAARNGPPLAVGHGDGEMFIGSDAVALSPFTDRITYLEDGDWAVLTRTSVVIRDETGAEVSREETKSNTVRTMVDKGNYRHFMLKEIYEQPEVIGHSLSHFVDFANQRMKLGNEIALPFNFADLDRVSFSACGTSYLAGCIAKYWFERFARLPMDIDIASEFRYREMPMSENGLSLFISQSGETADTLAALRYAKSQGQHIGAIVNVTESTIARESDIIFQTLAGPEIGVASTKAFTCQLSVLASLVITAARQRGHLTEDGEKLMVRMLMETPRYMMDALKFDDKIEELSRELSGANDVLYLGRDVNYPLAMEGALKLKEISYIHAEGYAAGELKHGPIALVDDDMPIIVLAPFDRIFEKTVSNMQEVSARGAKIILITDERGAKAAEGMAQHVLTMPNVPDFVAPMIYAIPVQMLAYHTAVHMGTDVDQPRNLAKSVTVE
ncbi:MAG: glutamine--fructose-6-phosphate transaminase (isomerizing) [Pseudomonadota bacterium]